MKLALGLMVCSGEGKWLNLHLPHLLPHVDGVVIVRDTDTDEETCRELVRLNLNTGKVFVYAHDWHWDFSLKANYLIAHAEQMEFEAILRLDPDETIYAATFDRLREALAVYDAVSFPRYNFERDRLHWMPQVYPDRQIRAWRLGCGIHYAGRVHEMPTGMRDLWFSQNHLYHYEGLRTDKRRYMKHHNYALLAQGQPPVYGEPLVIPDHHYRDHVPFEGEQPLDPRVIGIRAPLEDDV